jgi:hypothetical protein
LVVVMPLAFIALLSALVPNPGPTEPPALKSSKPSLFLSLSLGVDAVAAHWREPNPNLHETLKQLGPALRLAGGVQLGSQTAIFLDGVGTVPAVFPGWGVSVGGVGVGVDRFVRDGGPWHLRASARRAWAYRTRPLEAAVLPIIPPIRTIDDIWLFELAIGHARRTARLERGWMLAVFGGPLWVETGIGWIGGVSLARVWSRS